MSAPGNWLNNDDLRKVTQITDRYAKPFAIVMAAIAIPLALLYLTPVVLGWFAPALDPRIDLYAVNRPLAFTFLDADGNEVGHRGAIVGARLSLNDMPKYLPAAFIAMEDRRFYSHNGIDPVGLARAFLLDLKAHHFVAGGSTISQQTAKIVYTQQQRTMSRKLTELIDAAGLEKSLSKQQILQLYPQPHLSGFGRLWRRWRSARLFRHQRAAAHPGPGRHAGDPDARAIGLFPASRSAQGAAARQPGAGFHGR